MFKGKICAWRVNKPQPLKPKWPVKLPLQLNLFNINLHNYPTAQEQYACSGRQHKLKLLHLAT